VFVEDDVDDKKLVAREAQVAPLMGSIKFSQPKKSANERFVKDCLQYLILKMATFK
jgi:hypothetical protein